MSPGVDSDRFPESDEPYAVGMYGEKMSAPSGLRSTLERDTLAGALVALRRRWMIVAGVVLACLVVGVGKHERAQKTYASTANVAFKGETLSDAALQVAPSGSGEPQRDAATEVLIAHSSEVAEAVRTQLGLKESSSDLLDEVSVEAAPNADILQFTATTTNPAESARLANAFAQQYIQFKIRSQVADLTTAQNQLQQQINALPANDPERTSLQQSQQRLVELRAVAGGSANIIGRAAPSSKPVGKSLPTLVVICIVIGMAVSFLIIFLLESLDRRLKSIEEFEKEYRLPALASVPQSTFRPRHADARTQLLEPYRILRSSLDFAAVTRPLDMLMVTSAISGEGKTTVSVDLAHAIALTQRPVVLVELDLRRPTFVEHFRLDIRQGVTTALLRPGTANELLVHPFPELPNFAVLPSGPLPQNPSELLGSLRLVELLSELGSNGGVVIIDAPPLNPVADAQILLNNSAIQAAIIVGRVNRTKREAVRRARAILDRHTVEPVGIVVTGLRDPNRYGYEAYGGGASVPLDGRGDEALRADAQRRRLPV
jgi:capsular exopolysaccharide synthesis family protein